MHHRFVSANAARLALFALVTVVVLLATHVAGSAPAGPAASDTLRLEADAVPRAEGAPAAVPDSAPVRTGPRPLRPLELFVEALGADPAAPDAGYRSNRATTEQSRRQARHHARHRADHHSRQHAHPQASDTASGRKRGGEHPRKHVRKRHRPRVTGGRDISWPQCPPNVGIPDLRGLAQPMPEPGVRFVIIGLTNGRAFTRNPCLHRHLDWVRRHHVFAAAYAFTTYPTRGQLRRYGDRGPFRTDEVHGRLRNAGYAAAQYNIRTMRRHGFRTPHVWLDVEHSSSRPWSGQVHLNRAVVKGWLRAYRDAGYRVGFYSTTRIWRQILGRTRFGLPEWRTAGPDSGAAALRRCHEESFQGGRAVLAQWWTDHRDFDRMCPGHHGGKQMRRYFHRY